jgi:hypothetical protein
MTNSKYAAFAALDPFFDIIMQGLAGAVDGEHYFEAIADDAVFEYRYIFPDFPTRIEGRDALMALYAENKGARVNFRVRKRLWLLFPRGKCSSCPCTNTTFRKKR